MRYVSLLIILFFAYPATSQVKCGTLEPTSGEFENWMSSKISRKRSRIDQRSQQETIYTVPVVVHILHQGEPLGTGTNISDERIKGQIESLNADFRRLNEDRTNTPSEFLSVAADIRIEFVLARQDPKGNPTTGIVRVATDESYDPTRLSDNIEMRQASFWPAENYLNIYAATLKNDFIGLAIFPETDVVGVPLSSNRLYLDAVFVNADHFGNNPDAPFFESRGRTLTHEIGHFLGLRHPWGNGGCDSDDFVTDTPTIWDNHNGYGSPCTFPIPDTSSTSFDDGNSCVDDPDFPDMFQNYMDYTDDICMNLFTLGQKERMRVVIESSPRRHSLISSPGLIDPRAFTEDLSLTRIVTPRFVACGQDITPSVEVMNMGTMDISSYQVELSIDGVSRFITEIESTLTPLESNIIVFPDQQIDTTPASISFKIIAVNESIEDENAMNDELSETLNYTENINLPYAEDFESSNTLAGEFGMSNVWQSVFAPNELPGNRALVFEAFENNTSFDEETIISTPPLDLNGVNSAILSFSYAYAIRPDEMYDGLIVRGSQNCGETDNEVLLSLAGPNLATSIQTTNSFIPINELDWRDTTLGISSYIDLDDVQFQFIGLNGSGNNIYLDNIRIEETNVLPNDINLREIVGPLVTCREDIDVQLQVRNAGSQTITSFMVAGTVNGEAFTQSFESVQIKERAYETFRLNIGPLDLDSNQVIVNVIEVNDTIDISEIGNTVEATLRIDIAEDEFPLVVDFESTDQWINTAPEDTSIWERVSVAENGALRANGFSNEKLGLESWFISPALMTGGLDSAGLYFRLSYANRDGFNDQFRVLASRDCGETYTMTLLAANSDSLAITETTNQWAPLTDTDWKAFELDLSDLIFFQDEIRIAFVFTNGGGNDLYLDDISIRANDLPSYEDAFRVFPNPANDRFNLGFNLERKEAVTIEIVDMSGKIVSELQVPNALNQIIPFSTPPHPGLYFVRIVGNNFSKIQKLFVNR